MPIISSKNNNTSIKCRRVLFQKIRVIQIQVTTNIVKRLMGIPQLPAHKSRTIHPQPQGNTSSSANDDTTHTHPRDFSKYWNIITVCKLRCGVLWTRANFKKKYCCIYRRISSAIKRAAREKMTNERPPVFCRR